jgi:hypothetical protein
MLAVRLLLQLLGIDTSIGDGGDVSWWEPDLVPEEVEVEEEEEEGEAAEGGRVRQRRPTGKLVSHQVLPLLLTLPLQGCSSFPQGLVYETVR